MSSREQQLTRLQKILKASEELPELSGNIQFREMAVEEAEVEGLRELAVKLATVYDDLSLLESSGNIVSTPRTEPVDGWFRKSRTYREELPLKLLYIGGSNQLGNKRYCEIKHGIGVTPKGDLFMFGYDKSEVGIKRLRANSKLQEYWGETPGNVNYYWPGMDANPLEVSREQLRSWGIDIPRLLEVAQESLAKAVDNLSNRNQRVNERAEKLGMKI